ncbi:MAG: hypothetical protein U9N56_11815 [Actinomycetota bacterium]|nr:hypothetical protein [Actinomycetota bacterium]
MHWLLIYIVWMVYILLAMGILETASDRTQRLQGAGKALALGAFLGVLLTTAILWFGPIDPFGPY